MREHPVPQDVTGYQFHIIGNMTIKQFAEILAGVIIGFALYSTNLPDIIKWPLIILFVSLGGLAAFVPIEQQPLDHWISVFFRALYKPTQYYWRRIAHIPDPFLYKPSDRYLNQPVEVDLTPARKQRVKEYLFSVEQEKEQTGFEEYEAQRIASITQSFTLISGEIDGITAATEIVKPQLGVRMRSLNWELDDFSTAQQSPEQYTQSFQQTTAPVYQQPYTDQLYQLDQVAQNQVSAITQPTISSVAQPRANQTAQAAIDPSLILDALNQQTKALANHISFQQSQQVIQDTESLIMSPEMLEVAQSVDVINTSRQNTSTQQLPQQESQQPTQVLIPQSQAIKIDSQITSVTDQLPHNSEDIQSQHAYIPAEQVPQPQSQLQSGPLIAAQTNQELPFPTTPTTPNKVVGMVLSQTGGLVSDAIVEVKNTRGEIVRAVKTNSLGQFSISTPLQNGDYILSTEKPGFQFYDQQLILTGEIVGPIEIRTTE